MKIVCREFLPLRGNTLQGFAEITIQDIGLTIKAGLTIKDVAIHDKNGSRWGQLPARPVRGATLVTDDRGKVQYFPIIEFASREDRDEFSKGVIAAVLARIPRVFDEAVS
jgi:hypothetical protein